MAAGNFTQVDAFRLGLYEGKFDFATDSFYAVFVLATKTPAPSTDATYADISADEASGTGYAAGGLAIPTVSVTQSGGTVTVSEGSITVSNWQTSFRYVYMVKRVGAAAASTDPIVGELDGNTSLAAGTNLTFSAATTLTIDFPSGAVITDTHTP